MNLLGSKREYGNYWSATSDCVKDFCNVCIVYDLKEIIQVVSELETCLILPRKSTADHLWQLAEAQEQPNFWWWLCRWLCQVVSAQLQASRWAREVLL